MNCDFRHTNTSVTKIHSGIVHPCCKGIKYISHHRFMSKSKAIQEESHINNKEQLNLPAKARKEKEKGVESTEYERNNRGDNILEIEDAFSGRNSQEEEHEFDYNPRTNILKSGTTESDVSIIEYSFHQNIVAEIPDIQLIMNSMYRTNHESNEDDLGLQVYMLLHSQFVYQSKAIAKLYTFDL